MKKVIQLLFLTVLISSPQAIELSSGDNLFKKALAGEESYSTAASEYAHMIFEKSADPAELYYNLANTLYLDNKNIPALTAYSAALTYNPGNSDYLANRDFVLSEMELPVPVPSGTEYIFYAPVMLLGLYGSRMLLILLLLIALITAVLFISLKSEIYKTASIVVLILVFILSFSVFTWDYGTTAVVKDENTILRQGDSPLYEAVSLLPPGTEIKLLEERAGWYRIKTLRTHDMQSMEGWLRSSEVMQVSELIESLN
jgi:tetratricopeptide (TPR) repeat protein